MVDHGGVGKTTGVVGVVGSGLNQAAMPAQGQMSGILSAVGSPMLKGNGGAGADTFIGKGFSAVFMSPTQAAQSGGVPTMGGHSATAGAGGADFGSVASGGTDVSPQRLGGMQPEIQAMMARQAAQRGAGG